MVSLKKMMVCVDVSPLPRRHGIQVLKPLLYQSVMSIVTLVFGKIRKTNNPGP